LPAPPGSEKIVRRIALAGAEITVAATFGATLLRTESTVKTLRSIFASVLVKEVVVRLFIYKRDNALLSVALVPSNLTAPTSFDATRAIPTVQVAISNSVTGSEHTYTFRAGDVPGIEWDLAVEVVRFGHVGVLVSHDVTVDTQKSTAIADVQVTFVVECSGAGFGAAVGGATI
jgi:hypothetical protein